MEEPRREKTHHAKVVHHIPGRMRIRLHQDSRHAHVFKKLKTDLSTQPGVRGVEVNTPASSVTITYDAQQHSAASILGLLEDLDVLVSTVLDVSQVEEEHWNGVHSKAALTLAGALDDLNRQLSQLTGHTVDLKLLFPLGLIGAGLWQISKHGLMFERIPGWLLVWLGFDAFLKLHGRRDKA
jgi:copper chaperone CopZ